MSVETQKENNQDVSDAVIVDAVVEEDNSNSQESRTIVQEDDKEEKVVVSEKDNSDEELETYSENVQKRINQLTAKRKQALEEAQAAYQYAEHMKKENDQLKNGYSALNQGYVNEYENRVKSQSAQAQKLYEEATEAGDSKKQAEILKIMSQLGVEEERIRQQKVKINQQNQNAKRQAQQPQVAPQQPQVKAPDPKEDKKLQSWLSKNSWFNVDKIMTRGAQTIHEELILEEGFDPTTDEYYSEIDKRMRREFPHKFQEKRTSNAQVVTPASTGRSVKNGRVKKSVQLTPGQVAFANKMRIPLEKYAEEVIKIENRKQAGK
tara:strand:+ start:1820 stop:2782 length:963 start_codon:yes stop_codon:yes gene_type:complete